MVDFQTIITVALFLLAIFYMARLVYKNLFTKKECGNNCKCGVDFSAIKTSKIQKHL
jgi:hypothetical protein